MRVLNILNRNFHMSDFYEMFKLEAKLFSNKGYMSLKPPNPTNV